MAESKFSARDKMMEIRRELHNRAYVFPRLVAKGTLKQADADKRVAIMQEIEDEYRDKADREEASGRLF